MTTLRLTANSLLPKVNYVQMKSNVTAMLSSLINENIREMKEKCGLDLTMESTRRLYDNYNHGNVFLVEHHHSDSQLFSTSSLVPLSKPKDAANTTASDCVLKTPMKLIKNSMSTSKTTTTTITTTTTTTDQQTLKPMKTSQLTPLMRSFSLSTSARSTVILKRKASLTQQHCTVNNSLSTSANSSKGLRQIKLTEMMVMKKKNRSSSFYKSQK